MGRSAVLLALLSVFALSQDEKTTVMFACSEIATANFEESVEALSELVE
jgi:hypothetical protein